MDNTTDLVRVLLVIVAIVVLLPVVMMVFAWPMMGMWGGGHMWGGGAGGGAGTPWVWAVMWIVPLLVLLGGGAVLYRVWARSESDGTDAALEELRVAYARGELSDEEFETRRERLGGEEEGPR